jgi:hypothetical protein
MEESLRWDKSRYPPDDPRRKEQDFRQAIYAQRMMNDPLWGRHLGYAMRGDDPSEQIRRTEERLRTLEQTSYQIADTMSGMFEPITVNTNQNVDLGGDALNFAIPTPQPLATPPLAVPSQAPMMLPQQIQQLDFSMVSASAPPINIQPPAQPFVAQMPPEPDIVQSVPMAAPIQPATITQQPTPMAAPLPPLEASAVTDTVSVTKLPEASKETGLPVRESRENDFYLGVTPPERPKSLAQPSTGVLDVYNSVPFPVPDFGSGGKKIKMEMDYDTWTQSESRDRAEDVNSGYMVAMEDWMIRVTSKIQSLTDTVERLKDSLNTEDDATDDDWSYLE